MNGLVDSIKAITETSSRESISLLFSVIYVIDLRRAVYYQKCHDPDCQGYRSPLRPIPIDMILDPWYIYNSVQVLNHNGITNDNLDCQYVDDGCERVLLYNTGNDTDSCSKDSWWLKAVKVADDVECEQKKLDLQDMAVLFILRLSRNSGVLGLAGMAFISQMFSSSSHYGEFLKNEGIFVLHPLLHFYKEDMYKVSIKKDM